MLAGAFIKFGITETKRYHKIRDITNTTYVASASVHHYWLLLHPSKDQCALCGQNNVHTMDTVSSRSGMLSMYVYKKTILSVIYCSQ